MIETIAISADRPLSPSFVFKNRENDFQSFGWGIGWYPVSDSASFIVKDQESKDANALANIMEHTSNFYSSIFMGAFYELDDKRHLTEIQPFKYSYAGNDWMLVHNGALADEYRYKLSLEQSAYEPVGNSDSEHILCWLLHNFQYNKARSLMNVDFNLLHQWLKQINEVGSANIYLSSDNAMIIYQDKDDYDPIYYMRCKPPHNQLYANYDKFSVGLGIKEDNLKGYIVFSRHPHEQDVTWVKLLPGQMLVVSQGAIIWDSNLAKGFTCDVPENQAQPSDNTQYSPEYVTFPHRVFGINNMTDRRILTVTHQTRYTYEFAVKLSKHLIRLQPVFDPDQVLLDYKLDISCPHSAQMYDDVFGNKARYVEISTPYNELIVDMTATVSLPRVINLQKSLILSENRLPLPWMPWQRQLLSPYLLPSELPESQLSEMMDYANSFAMRNNNNIFAVLDDINLTIYQDYDYVAGSTTLATTAFDVYVNRRGVCQDFANLFICLARLLSIPARYRAGYIYTGEHYDNPEQGDATHAWVEIYLPRCGWVGYDPTNGCKVNSDHIRVACGREFHDATPTSGTIYQGGGGNETLSINVKVREG